MKIMFTLIISFYFLITGQTSAQFVYEDFISTNGLKLVVNATQIQDKIRLSSASIGRRGAVWFTTKQNVEDGFETTFQFQFTDQGGVSPRGADGIAFVIQNVSDAEISSNWGASIGYLGIENSLAVEFDTWLNGENADPNGNHISVQTRGTIANSSHHSYSLGSTTTIPDLKNQSIYTAKIIYNGEQLKIFLNDLYNPVLSVNINLSATLDLDDGKAFVGFTSATGSAYQNHYLLSWTLSQLPPLSILLPDGGEIWPDGITQKIKWNAIGITNVNIDLSLDGGEWTNLAQNIPAELGIYDWEVNISGTHQCRIRISESITGLPNVISNDFSVVQTIPLNNGDLVFNGYHYLLQWPAPDEPHKLVFYFSDSTNIYRPPSFTESDSLVVQSERNYFVLSTIADQVAAKYYWKVYDNDWNPITAKNVFMLVNLTPPEIPPINQPMILVHGWNSSGIMWDTLKPLLSSSYSLWTFEYPNTGDIKQSAWGLSRVIDTVLSRSPGFSKVKILAHSMGGLVTRAYTVNMAKDLLNNTIYYTTNKIDNIAFLATPHKGGLFVQLANILGIGGKEQYAITQLERSSDFINELNSHQLNSNIKYLAIAGYDNNLPHYFFISLQIPPRQLSFIFNIFSDVVRKWWASDCVVQLESAIGAPRVEPLRFFDQYKIVERNHSNIYKNEFGYPIYEINDILEDFFQDGIIQSDNYNNFLNRNIAGKISRPLFTNASVQSMPLSGAEIHLIPEKHDQPYITFSDKDGKFSFNFLPSGNYTIALIEDENIIDSGSVVLSDSIVSATYNLFNLLG